MEPLMITMDMNQTLAMAVVVLLVGKFLCTKVQLFNRFCIPAPVVGGIIFSLVNLVGHQTGLFGFNMNFILKDFFMVFFFTTIGFSASFKMLKKGGIQVVVFLAVATALVVLQNVLGVTLANLFGLHPLMGLATGSVPMTGGHGTAGAFGPVFVEYGAARADVVAIASATFGLVAGSLIGGPIARFLIVKNNLIEKNKENNSNQYDGILPEDFDSLKASQIGSAFFYTTIAMGIGSIIFVILNNWNLKFPVYIGSMLIAVVIRNVADSMKVEVPVNEISTLGDVFLGLFLAMALMSLNLWELADLAGPLVVMLMAQAIFMTFYAIFVTFPVMGKDYDAAVITAGHCGFGLGATPNAMANMKTVCDKFMMSPKAFFILPIVGGMFIDFTNSFVITAFANYLK